jgi:XisH protein
MSAKDAFHYIVKNALQKEGWTITHDPLPISFGKVQMQVDLGAEKLLAAEREGEKIAVEVKSFISTSAIYDFHTALGQFINYRTALKLQEPERALYLAVPLVTYKDFFTLPFTQLQIQDYQIKLIVYDIEIEEIVQWQS